MPAEHDVLALAADFGSPTRDDWRESVRAVLQKSGIGDQDEIGDPELALSYRTYDGIEIRPLYTAADARPVEHDGRPGYPPFVRGASVEGATTTGWQVLCRHAGRDVGQVNAAVLADLERGGTASWLVLGAGGLQVGDLPAALDGVYLELAPIVLDAGADTLDAARALLELATQRGVALGDLAGSFGADPIGVRARTGAAADLGLLGRLHDLRAAAVQMRLATVDGTVYHDAGASDAQEIGITTAVGVAYLRALTDAGMPLDAALDAIEFRWAVTAQQFASIAKLRAARRVWDRVAQLSGAAEERRGQRQHAVTSAAMLTRRDPWVNLLRTTIACFAAAIGGAQAITVAPFDAAIGESDGFAQRIARNTQSVLHDEASLARVLDAAGGSWFVESLTDELASAAWDVFTSVERAGGALSALDDGGLETMLAATRAARADDIAHRRAPITGVSEFAFVGEEPLGRPNSAPIPTGGLLPVIRYAQEFEALRDRADAAPQRPTVFLAALGPSSQHAARVAFTTNLLAAGGITPVVGTVDAGGSTGTAQIVDAFRSSGSAVACICGPDAIYGHAAEPVAAALRSAGAAQVWLAGRADVSGIDGLLYAGSDALGALTAMLTVLEVA